MTDICVARCSKCGHEFVNRGSMRSHMKACGTDQLAKLRTLFAEQAEKGSTVFHQAHAEELLMLADELIALRSESKESELHRVMRLIATTPTTQQGKYIENCAAVFQQMAKTALENAAPQENKAGTASGRAKGSDGAGLVASASTTDRGLPNGPAVAAPSSPCVVDAPSAVEIAAAKLLVELPDTTPIGQLARCVLRLAAAPVSPAPKEGKP